MDLNTYLSQPAPRALDRALLAPTRQRLRTQLITLLALIAAPGLLTAVIVMVSPRAPPPDALSTLLCSFVGIVALVGAPCALYFSQGYFEARALLIHGERVDAVAESLETSIRGNLWLKVSLAGRDAQPQSWTFLVSGEGDEARAVVGAPIALVRHPKKPDRVGIVLPGRGLITAR